MTEKNQPNINQNPAKENPDISIKEYRAAKRKLIHTEPDNYTNIIVIPCSGNKGWYELAEHSALIYYYAVCKKLGKKVAIHADTDSHYEYYQIGFIRSKGVDNIRNNLKKADLYQSESESNHAFVFNLSTTYTDRQINEFRRAEQSRRLQNLYPVPVHNLDPEMYRSLTYVGIRLHKLCNSRLDRLSSRVVGDELVILIHKVLENYHKITTLWPSQHQKLIELFTAMRRDIFQLIMKIQIISELKLWSFETCIELNEPLREAYERVKDYLQDIQTKQKVTQK